MFTVKVDKGHTIISGSGTKEDFLKVYENIVCSFARGLMRMGASSDEILVAMTIAAGYGLMKAETGDVKGIEIVTEHGEVPE